MSEISSDIDLRPFSTLLKMIAIAGLILLGCFSACLGSITITLLRIRYGRAVGDIANANGRFDRKSYTQNIQPVHGRAHASEHVRARDRSRKRANERSRSHKRDARSKAALAIAERACDAALKHLEERIGPQLMRDVVGTDLDRCRETSIVPTSRRRDVVIEIHPPTEVGVGVGIGSDSSPQEIQGKNE